MKRDIVFYDGDCGFCHASVRHILMHDRRGRFRIAPLDGETFEALGLAPQLLPRPDSLVVMRRSGGLLTRSDAVLYIASRLGGTHRVLAGLAALVPRFLRDPAYAVVARVRRRLAPRPRAICPVLPAGLRRRFLP